MLDFNKYYNNIYIIESYNHWDLSKIDFNFDKDLVLTFDFKLKREIQLKKGSCFYIDNIGEPLEMEENNHLASVFFKNWHSDENGKDIFNYLNISFGFAFRIHIWSEYLYIVRLMANLNKIKNISYKKIFVFEKDNIISKCLFELNLVFSGFKNSENNIKENYFFDIHTYMKNSLEQKRSSIFSKRYFLLHAIKILNRINIIFNLTKNKKNIFVQVYHPTIDIINELLKNKKINIFTPKPFLKKDFSRILYSDTIPERKFNVNFEILARDYLKEFQLKKWNKLILYDSIDISSIVYDEITSNITKILPKALYYVHNSILFFEKRKFDLEILFSNLGLSETIVDCVLKHKNTTNYLIINGLMSGSFCDEAKYALYINSYSESIKRNYFNDSENVLCLGDPRMDKYINYSYPKNIDRINPTITIGTSGFNNLDLNSYTAIEFEFMFDILTSFLYLKNLGYNFDLIIKVRPNGFLSQYQSFHLEYFESLNIEILTDLPMIDVLRKTDLYISIYSQTIFEASCLGIPVIYYKKDKEYLDPPFDNKSELVTASSVEDLKNIYLEFLNNSDIFTPFLDKKVMEKYIGPLDGKNLERNLSFIYKLIEN